MSPKRWIPLIGAVLAGALPVFASDSNASTLFVNGRFWLNDEKGTVAHALLARNGRVVAVGDLADLQRRPEAVNAQKIDLGGGTAVPGLQDGHADLAGLALSFTALDLSTAHSYTELIERVAARAKDQKEGTWIVGWGWDERNWPERSLPHHVLLSSRVTRNPVMLFRRDLRAALLNEQALVLAKLDGVLQGPPRGLGGRILEDGEGHATGVLLDGAIELARRVLPIVERRELENQILRVQDELLSRGITAVHDFGTRRSTLEALRDLEAQGKLAMRVVCYLDGNVEYDESLLADEARRAADEDLCVGGVRFRLDGTLDLKGAALLEPYVSDPAPREKNDGASRERGELLIGDDDLAKRVSGVVRNGMQPVFEAEGDQAVRTALDLLERVAAAQGGLEALRPRIESALLVATKDWPRFPGLGVVPSLQPALLHDEIGLYAPLIGEQRMLSLCAWRALVPQLGRVAFGSGAPAGSFDPRRGLASARTAVAPEGHSGDEWMPRATLSGDAALFGYTSDAAWACRQEARRGKLQPGFAADMTVFAADPVQASASSMEAMRVRMTVIDGVVAWRAR